MSQAVEATHTTAVRKARRAVSGRDWRGLAGTVSLMAVGLILTAAPVYVLLAEKGVAVSPPLWSLALEVCRVITGLLGLLTVMWAVPGRGADSTLRDIFGSIVAGVVGIAAAVVGLGLVIVVTGLAGLTLLYATALAAAEAFRAGVESRRVQSSRGRER